MSHQQNNALRSCVSQSVGFSSAADKITCGMAYHNDLDRVSGNERWESFKDYARVSVQHLHFYYDDVTTAIYTNILNILLMLKLYIYLIFQNVQCSVYFSFVIKTWFKVTAHPYCMQTRAHFVFKRDVSHLLHLRVKIS